MGKKILKAIAGAPDRPLNINGIEIQCYVLENEVRVLSGRGMEQAFNVSRGGANPLRKTRVLDTRLPRFANSEWLEPHIDKLVSMPESPILFNQPTGGTAYGYPAQILVDICNAILDAHQAGNTTERQAGLVERAMILIRGLAKVGIIALVDEATGYQEVREKRALAKILEKFIAKELQSWTRTFPYEFYEQIFRLKKWSSPNGMKRPSVIGHYTNDIVYDRLAPGVLEELRRCNPITSKGARANRHHQWFTRDHGYPALREHLAAVIALMKASSNWGAFKRAVQKAFPKVGDQETLDFD